MLTSGVDNRKSTSEHGRRFANADFILMTELSEYDGYYAEVLIHSAESVAYDAEGNVVPLSQRYDDKNPVEIIYRGDKVCVRFVGLQYIESKAAKSGVTDETIYIVDPKKAGVRKVGDD